MKKSNYKNSVQCALIILFLHIIFVSMLQAQNTSNPNVGAIPGVIDVSPMGAATYTIPIEVVPGTQGVQPNLSIVYNSFAGMGMLGMNWNLSGVSAITRSAPKPYYDGYDNPIPIQFTKNRFTLDGERLISIGTGQNTYYATEAEDFTRIYPQSNFSSFVAFIDDGSIHKYGSSVNSRQIMGNTANILSWLIDTVTDFNGNSMSFHYWKPQNNEEVLISYITYTRNSKFNLHPFAEVHFNYRDLPETSGMNTYFVAGYPVQQTKLLETIEVYYGHSIVRKYKFIYNLENTAQIKEIALYDNEGQSLNKTTIGWEKQNSNPPPKTIPTPDGNIIFGDFNGDGYTDYIMYNETSGQNTWTLFLGSPNQTFEDSGITGVHKSASYFYKADVDGCGGDELIIAQPVDGEFGKYEFSIISLKGYGTLRKEIIENFYQLHFGDFDGDGKTDILIVKKNSNGNRTFQIYDFNYNKFNHLSSLNSINSSCKVRVGDFTGNGKTDVELNLPDDNIQTYYYDKYSGQFVKFLTTTPASTADYFRERYSGDFNGDGITDVLTYDRFSWHLYFGKGNGEYTNPTTVSLNPTFVSQPEGSVPKYRIIIADIDGDGKDDIIQLTSPAKILYSKGCVGSPNTETFVYIYHSENLTFDEFELTPDNFNIADFNNDGILDIIVQKTRTNKPKVYYFRNKYNLPNEIIDGIGKTIKLDYKPRYLPANEFNLSLKVTKKYFLYLLEKLQLSNGLGTFDTTLYEYEYPAFSRLRMSLLGFKEFICTNVAEGKEEKYEYGIDSEGTTNSMHVLIPRFHTVSYNSQVYSVTDFRASLQTVFGNKRYIMFTSPTYRKALSYITINNLTTLLNSEGRLIESEIWIEDARAGIPKEMFKEKVLIEKKYYSYKKIMIGTNQIKTVLEKIITTKRYGNSGANDMIRDTLTFNYAETGTNIGRLNWERQGNRDGSITTKYSYAETGACSSKTVSAEGCAPRTESYKYDITQRFLNKITNPLGHITQISYDSKTGNKLQEIDPNGLKTTYKYNSFGNLTEINYPDGTQTTISMNWNTAANPQNAKYFTTTTTSGKADLLVYYDLLGRVVCCKEDGYYFQTKYNTQGQVKSVSGPFNAFYLQDENLHEYTYDEFGRKKTEKAPFLDLSYSYYLEKVSVTDNLRNVTSYKDYDALGRITTVVDPGGIIKYEYTLINQDGKVRQQTVISSNEEKTTIISDQWDNRILISEPNAGVITSIYNKFNELVKQIDARNNTIKYHYDLLGRLTQKQYIASGSTTQTIDWIYDNAQGKGKGKLSKIMVNGAEREIFSYDKYSRLNLHSKFLGSWYSFKYSYNENGQLDTLTYPGYFAVNYSYMPNGKLSEIRRNCIDDLIYKVNKRNKFNATTKCEYGNGVATDYTYDNNGMLTRINTGNKITSINVDPGGGSVRGDGFSILPNQLAYIVDSSILNYRYTYNDMGLMVSRSESVSNRNEIFKYDNLDRLIKVTATDASQNISYSLNGNIEKYGTGTYTYGSIKPHAVTLLEGNPTPLTQITYNFFNQPTSITGDNNKLTIFYGADQQRNWVTKYKFTGRWVWENSHYYVSKYFEREHNSTNIHHYHYIYGDDGVVALYIATTLPKDSLLFNNNFPNQRDETVEEAMYYIHTDHLGSYCVVTDNDKNIVQSNRFGVWGNTVGAGNFSITKRGFTGHEHYPEFKIINMNARLYDPVIARFFSPDNFVQMPEFTQGFNRYSYCLNNPLKYKDPSGNKYVLNDDIWEFDRNGKFLQRIDEPKYDQMRIKNDDGSVYKESQKYDFGFLENTMTFQELGEVKISGFKEPPTLKALTMNFAENTKGAMAAFRFLGENTKPEWHAIGIYNWDKSYVKDNILVTNHQPGWDYSGARMAEGAAPNGYLAYSFHSHKNNPFPSDKISMNGREGDIEFRLRLIQQSPDAKFGILYDWKILDYFRQSIIPGY